MIFSHHVEAANIASQRKKIGDTMKIGFIGAGKVGFSLGKFFVDGNIPVTGYYSRHPESAREAAEFTGTRQYEDVAELVKDSDAIFVTVLDGQIRAVYEQLRKMEISQKQICHCSGAMTAEEAFYDLSSHSAYGYSIHPLFPVSSKYETYQKLSDAFFCLEGSGPHLRKWQSLLENLGAKTRLLDGKKKTKYHAACAIASNLVCGLFQESMEMLTDCGFSEEESLQALSPLAMANLTRILEVGPREALTGPIERNDVETVKKHMACFSSVEDRLLYGAVSAKVVQIAKERHPDSDYAEMQKQIKDGIRT